MLKRQKTRNFLSLFLVMAYALVCLFLFLFLRDFIYMLLPAPKPFSVFRNLPTLSYNECDPRSLLITYEYTIDLPVAEIQHHYEDELAKYCKTEWVFSDTSKSCDGNLCRIAICDLDPPPFALIQEDPIRIDLRQHIYLKIQSIPGDQTQVFHRREIRTFIDGKIDGVCGE
jgi:hypothetical protein